MPIFRTISQYMLPILVFGIAISGCSNKLAKDENPTVIKPFAFEQHEVVTGTAKRQTVLTGFLSGNANAELVVVYIAEDDTRHLHIYAFNDDIWTLKHQIKLRPQISFVDLVTIGERDILITYDTTRLNRIDLDSAIEHTLFDINTNYKVLNESVIPHVDITRDLNGDGRDDIIIPDLDGFWIATQLKNGSFSKPIKIGPTEPFLEKTAMGDPHNYREVGINDLTVLWYLSRVHQMDYNRDTLTDLVFWNTDHFEVYFQNPDGQFSQTAETFTTDVPFDTDGAYSIAFEYSSENMLSLIFGFRKKTKRKVLHMFSDINNDGISDMVIHTLEGRSLGNQRSRYDVHFGKPIPDGTMFIQDVDLTIRPRGSAGALLPWGYSSQWLEDFDGDGDIDILFKDVHTALFGMTRALMGNSIAINLEFYRMEDNTYPAKPNKRLKIRPDLDIFDAPGVFFPAVLFGDVNGDKHSDLIVGKGWNEMHIFFGIAGTKPLTRKPQKVEVAMPNDERNIRLVELNKDDKKDILIYYGSSAEPHRVTMLIAK